MNILALDRNIENCAKSYADQHVVKMMIECTQILCTVLNNNGIKTPVKSTMPNHPCTIWAGQSLSNWIWLRALVLALNKEFKYRFGKNKDYPLAAVVRGLPLPPIEDICMKNLRVKIILPIVFLIISAVTISLVISDEKVITVSVTSKPVEILEPVIKTKVDTKNSISSYWN